MNRIGCGVVIALLIVATTVRGEDRTITLDDLRNKVRGAWAGKMIGVSQGFPTEFKFRGVTVPPDGLPKWNPVMVRESLRQDDLYIQMTFAQVLDERGIDATTDDFAKMFRESKYSLWHANQAGRRALRRGAPPAESGTPKYTTHGNDISFQIDADFIGLMCPAMPQASNDLIHRAGRIIAWGDGIYGGMFVAGMYAAAYFETDSRKVVEAGLACLPPESDYAKVITDVLAWSKEERKDWESTWRRVNEKWDGQDRCPYGALEPLNIDAKINGAYVAIGLLYGGDDFWRTIEIATRCGQDSDCNPSTAAGVWGAMRGYRAIPEQYTGGIPQIADTKFVYTEYTFDAIVDSTIQRATLLAERHGGSSDGHQLAIKAQAPKPTPVKAFTMGKPVERIGCDDAARWTWEGDWKREVSAKVGAERAASGKGSAATIEFSGTGAIVCGPYSAEGGMADVYIDGKLDCTVDVADDDGRRKVMDSVWHRFDLPPGKHTLKLVVRGEPFGHSKGTEIRVHSLIIYR